MHSLNKVEILIIFQETLYEVIFYKIEVFAHMFC